MSDSESEDAHFDDDSGSEGYIISPKAAKLMPLKKSAVPPVAIKAAKVSSHSNAFMRPGILK